MEWWLAAVPWSRAGEVGLKQRGGPTRSNTVVERIDETRRQRNQDQTAHGRSKPEAHCEAPEQPTYTGPTTLSSVAERAAHCPRCGHCGRLAVGKGFNSARDIHAASPVHWLVLVALRS